MRNRNRLRMTTVSGCALHPVPVAHHILFRLRITFDIACALLTVPVAQIFPVSVAQLIPAAVSQLILVPGA